MNPPLFTLRDIAILLLLSNLCVLFLTCSMIDNYNLQAKTITSDLIIIDYGVLERITHTMIWLNALALVLLVFQKRENTKPKGLLTIEL